MMEVMVGFLSHERDELVLRGPRKVVARVSMNCFIDPVNSPNKVGGNVHFWA